MHIKKKHIKHPLPEKTCVNIVTLIEALESVHSISDFKKIISSELRRVLPHELTIFGIGDPRTLRIDALISIDYPENIIKALSVQRSNGVVTTCPVAEATISSANYLEINNTLNFCTENETWAELVREHGIKNTFAKAQLQNGGKQVIFHGFTNGDVKNRDSFRRISNIVLPHLDKTIFRLLNPTDARQLSVNITEREQQILKLLGTGYKDKDIASELSISLFTVKRHVQNILTKLESKNRTQAVMKALEYNLIVVAQI
jgi:DNA-binding CsgD family transcriptional regulator